jgi:hypothetical protein
VALFDLGVLHEKERLFGFFELVASRLRLGEIEVESVICESDLISGAV